MSVLLGNVVKLASPAALLSHCLCCPQQPGVIHHLEMIMSVLAATRDPYCPSSDALMGGNYIADPI